MGSVSRCCPGADQSPLHPNVDAETTAARRQPFSVSVALSGSRWLISPAEHALEHPGLLGLLGQGDPFGARGCVTVLAGRGLDKAEDGPCAQCQAHGQGAGDAFQLVAVGDGFVALVFAGGVDAITGLGVVQAVEVAGAQIAFQGIFVEQGEGAGFAGPATALQACGFCRIGGVKLIAFGINQPPGCHLEGFDRVGHGCAQRLAGPGIGIEFGVANDELTVNKQVLDANRGEQIFLGGVVGAGAERGQVKDDDIGVFARLQSAFVAGCGSTGRQQIGGEQGRLADSLHQGELAQSGGGEVGIKSLALAGEAVGTADHIVGKDLGIDAGRAGVGGANPDRQ